MRAFVSLPVGETFEPVFETLAKVVMLRGMHATRSTSAHDATVFSAITPVSRDILESRLIIADLTGHHPKVLQEVNYANRLGKPLILMSQDVPDQAAPHVTGTHIYHYDLEDLDRLHDVVLQASMHMTMAEAEATAADDMPMHGSISAKISMMQTMTSHWKNPFA